MLAALLLRLVHAGKLPPWVGVANGAALLLGLLIGSGAAVPAEPWTLLRIRAFGSERFREPDVVAATGLEPGATVTLESFEKASARLSRLGTFAEVTYRYSQDGRNAIVQFHVRDARSFLPCRFENFVWFTDAELDAAKRILAGTQTMTVYKSLRTLTRLAARSAVTQPPVETLRQA